MLPTDLIPEPSWPKFATIRARLARAYLEHKDDLDVPNADDVEIIKHVNEITIVLLDGASEALRTENLCWLDRYKWFAEIVEDIIDGRPGEPLDG